MIQARESTLQEPQEQVVGPRDGNLSGVAQLHPTLCDPVDYTVHGILQARTLEWVAYPFSRVSFQPRNQTQNTGVGSLSLLQGIFPTQESNQPRVSCIAGDSLPAELPGKPSWRKPLASEPGFGLGGMREEAEGIPDSDKWWVGLSSTGSLAAMKEPQKHSRPCSLTTPHPSTRSCTQNAGYMQILLFQVVTELPKGRDPRKELICCSGSQQG